VSTVRELVKVNPLFKEHFNFYTQKIDIVDPFKLADFAATLSTAEGPELQVGREGGRRGGLIGRREGARGGVGLHINCRHVSYRRLFPLSLPPSLPPSIPPPLPPSLPPSLRRKSWRNWTPRSGSIRPSFS